MVTVLNQICEEDFLGFSYGFRPGRSQHQALDALWVGIMRKKVNWILDADVRSFFDDLSHEWLVKFIEHRVADRRILRLIQKWLRAGVSEEGEWTKTEVGTPQGAVEAAKIVAEAGRFQDLSFPTTTSSISTKSRPARSRDAAANRHVGRAGVAAVGRVAQLRPGLQIRNL
jgi:hypothetical protein